MLQKIMDVLNNNSSIKYVSQGRIIYEGAYPQVAQEIMELKCQIAREVLDECDKYYELKYGELPIVAEIRAWLDQQEKE